MIKQLQTLLPTRLIRFIYVGAIGFVVDATVLNILIFELEWGYYLSRVISFGVAVPCTWILNRRWTFRETASPNRSREYTSYLVIQTIGALINFVIYSACIFFSSLMMRYPVVALAMGSGVAMIFNFIVLKRFTFTGQKPRPEAG